MFGSGLATDQEGWPLVVLGHTEQSNLWQFRRLCKKKFSPWATLTCIQVQKAVKRFYMLITAHFSGYEMTCLLATLSLASSFSGTATALWFTHREAFSISREHWTLRWRLPSSCPGHHRKDRPSRTNKKGSSSPRQIFCKYRIACAVDWFVIHSIDPALEDAEVELVPRRERRCVSTVSPWGIARKLASTSGDN